MYISVYFLRRLSTYYIDKDEAIVLKKKEGAAMVSEIYCRKVESYYTGKYSCVEFPLYSIIRFISNNDIS